MTLRQPATKARGGQPGVRYITDDLIKKVTGQEHLAGVTSLNLNLSKDSNKRFKFIENLDRLKKLQTLNISYNGIEKMEKLERLSTLRELNLAYNSITKIEGIECITRLQVLNLTGNQIVHLPSWIGKRLKALRVFKIANNLLQSLDEFAKLRPLKDLSQLTVADNPVASLPHCRPYLLFQLTTLEVIDGQPISEQEREAAHNRFAQEEVTGLLDQLEKKESEMERIQQVHNTSLQEGISREQKQLQQLDKYKQQQEAMKELRHELDTKSQLLKQKTSELMTASNKHYELEQELAFYKIDHKFGALSAPPRLPTPDSGAEAHDNDGLFGESPYIGKGRFQKLQRPGEKRFRGQVGQGTDSTDLVSTGGETLSVDSEAREKMRQALDKDLEDKRQAIASAQDQLGQLHNDLAQTELQLQQANDELHKVATATPGNHLTEDDKQHIRSTLFDKIDKIHMLRDETSQVEEEMGRAQTEIQQREGEIGMLKGRMLRMSSKDQLYKGMEQEVADMEDQLVLGQQQYRSLQDQTSHMLQTIAHETHNIKSLEGELREGQAAYNDELKGELENIISGLQAYLSEARSSAEQQRVECETLHREKGELMQRLQHMEEENGGVMDEQAAEISSLREKLVDLEESLLENQERNESLTQQLEDSHIQEANEADLSARLNEAEEEVERMKEQVVQAHKQAKKEIEDYQKKLDLENRKLRYLKDKARDADTKEDEIRNLHRELSELQASNVHLQDQLFGMNQRLLEEKKKSINPEDLRRRLEAVTRAIKTGEPLEGDEREGSVGRALGDIHDRVKREMDKSRSDAEQAAGAMEKAEEEVKTLKDQVVQVQLKEREMAEMAIQSMVTEEKKEADRLRNELNRLSQELERTRDTARQAMRERDQERLRAIEKERELEKVVPVRLLEASPRAASSAASSSPTATTSETESVTTEITAPTTESTSTIPSAEWPVKKQELYESMNQDEQELFDELQQEIEQLRELLFRRDHKEAADMAVQAEQTAKQLRTMLDSHSSTSSGVESSTGSTIRHTTVKSLAKTGQRSPRATLELTRAEEEIARLKQELCLGHNPISTGHQRASTIVSQEAEIDDLRDLVDVQQGQIDALHRELGGHRERRGHNDGRVGRSTHGPLVESQPHEDEIYAAEYTQTQSGRDDLPATRGRPVPTFYPSTDRPQAYQKAAHTTHMSRPGGQREEHRPSPTTYNHSPTRQHSPSRRHATRPPAEPLYYSPQSQHPMHQGRPEYYPEAPGGRRGTAGFGDGPDLAGASGVVDRMPTQTGPSNPTAIHLHPSVPAADLPGSYGVNPAQHGDVNQPGAFGANPNQQGAFVANPNQPGVFGGNPNQPGAFGSNPNQPSAFGANPNQPGAFGANPNQPGVFGANPNQPGPFVTNPNQPGAFVTNPNQPGAFGANPNQPGAFGANPNQPGAFGVHQPPLLENAVHQLPTSPVRSHPILIEGDQATTPIAGSLNLRQVFSGPTTPGTLPSQPVMMSTPTTKGAPLRGILKRADGQVLPGDSLLLGDSSLLANEDMICTVPEHHDLEDYMAKLQAKVKRLQSKLGKVEWDTVDNSRRRVGFEGSPENNRVQRIQLELQERRQDLEGLDLAVERQKENLRKMREKEKSLLARQNSNLRQLEALGVIKPSHSRRAYLSGEASYNLDEEDYEMEYTPRGQRPHKLSYLQEEIACLEETLAKRRAELRHADQLLQDCQDDLISARKQAKLSLDEHVVARRVQKQTLLDVDELEKRAHQVGVEVIRTEEQLEDLRTEVDELQDLRNSQEEMLAQIKQVIRKKDTEFQEIDSETKTALQRLESIHEKLEELTGEEQERLRDNKHTLAHQQSQLTSISQQLTSGQGELERLTQDLGRGRIELQLLQDTIRKRQGQLENLDRDVEREIQAKRRELQEVDDKLLGLQLSRKNVDREITECKSQLEKEGHTLMQLEADCSRRSNDLERLKQRQEHEQREVEALSGQRKSLEKTLGEMRTEQRELEEAHNDLHSRLVDLQRSEGDVESKVRDLNQEAVRVRRELSRAEEALEDCKHERTSLNRDLLTMRANLLDGQGDLDDIHRSMKEAEGSVQQLKERETSGVENMRQGYLSLEDRVRNLGQELVKRDREAKKLTGALEKARSELHDTRSGFTKELQFLREKAANEIADLEGVAQTHYSRANRLSNELDDLRSEHANLVSKLENEEEKLEQERKFHETLLHLKDDMKNEVFERGRLTCDIIETTPQRDSIEQQLATLKENLHMIRSGADPLTVFVRKPDGAQFSFTEQQEYLKKQLEQKMSRHVEAMHSKQQLSQNNIFSLQKKLSSLERVLSTSCSDLTSDKRHTAHIPTRDAAHTVNKQSSFHKEVIPLAKFSPANSSQLSKVSDFPEKCVAMEIEDTESKENDSGSGTRDLHTDDVAITTERPVSPASVPRRAYSPHRHSTQRSARLINQT